MSTCKEHANPNTSEYSIDLTGLTLVQVLWLLSEQNFTITASKRSMWEFYLDKRLMEGEKDPPVYIVWINDGEAKKLTIIDGNGDEKQLQPGLDLHCFVQPKSVDSEPEWFAINSARVMK